MWGMTVTKNKKNKKYHYQPELATSIIYWSVCFSSFFVSLIIVLEQFKVTFFCLLFFLFFSSLVYLGLSRYFSIIEDELLIKTIFKKNRQQIKINQIEKITVGTYGVTLFSSALSDLTIEERTFLMLPKSKDKFIADLKSQPAFCGKIVGIKKSVGLD